VPDTLRDFVVRHTERGECKCGKCYDRRVRPEPQGHTADLTFFKVCAKSSPNPDDMREVVRNHQPVFTDAVDPLDGEEHNYIELGAWAGDQETALRMMGLGSILGLWKLLTPNTILGDLVDEDMKMAMAQRGFVCIQAEKGGDE